MEHRRSEFLVRYSAVHWRSVPIRVIAYLWKHVMTIPTLSLSTGGAIPVVGLGMWKVENSQAPALVRQAIEVGYRHFDCACDYGNEAEIGVGLQRAIAGRTLSPERSVDHLQAVEHLPPPRPRAGCLGPYVERSATGLSRPLSDSLSHCAEFRAVCQALSAGLVLRSRRTAPAHGGRSRVDRGNLGSDGIAGASRTRQEHWRLQFRLLAAARSARPTRESIRPCFKWSRIPTSPRRNCCDCATRSALCTRRSRRWDRCRTCRSAWPRLPIPCWTTRVVRAIAGQHGKTAAQVLLRWGVQRRTVVIPKTSNPDHLRENLAIFDFELSPAEMAQLNALDQHRRFNDPGVFCEKAFNTFFPIYE